MIALWNLILPERARTATTVTDSTHDGIKVKNNFGLANILQLMQVLGLYSNNNTNLQWKSLMGSLRLLEDNGTPLQYSRLENPMDGGAW